MSADFWMGAFIGAVLVLLLLLFIVAGGGKKNTAKAQQWHDEANKLLEKRNELGASSNALLRAIADSLDKGSPKIDLHDWFAGMAMSALAEKNGSGQVGLLAYSYADAMLKARAVWERAARKGDA